MALETELSILMGKKMDHSLGSMKFNLMWTLTKKKEKVLTLGIIEKTLSLTISKNWLNLLLLHLPMKEILIRSKRKEPTV